MAGVMGIRKFAREQQPGKITERVYPPSPELVQLNDLSMSGFDPVMDLPRVIELAQEVERPRVAAAPAGEPLAPQRPSTPRELTITASRAAPVEQAPENLSRALWEIYNRTENPADFVRADEAMMRERMPAKDGGKTAQGRKRETVKSIGKEPEQADGEGWQRALAYLRQYPMRPGEAELRPYNPAPRDMIGGMIAGDDPRSPAGVIRGRLADALVGSTGLEGSGTIGFGALDVAPRVGAALQVGDVGKAMQDEDYLTAGAMAALPAAFAARRQIADAGRRALEVARQYAPQAGATAAVGATMMPQEAEAGGGSAIRRALQRAEDIGRLRRPGSGYEPIPGAPATVNIPGIGKVEARPIPELEAAASNYMRSVGRPNEHAVERFVPINEDYSRRVAQAFEEMKHDPTSPPVRRAFDALADETLAQYRAAKEAGIDVRFLKPGEADPYAASPALGYEDIMNRGRLFVFPTDQGFGSSGGILATNPLVKGAGRIGDKPDALVNDAFRVVHDLYGHFGPGNPFFRAPGEERAYQLHSRMYSPEARPAAATETRGQNSWVNFGPYGERNRAALSGDTIYADQKTGLLPEWAMELPPEKAEGGAVENEPGIVDRALSILSQLNPIGSAEAAPVKSIVRGAAKAIKGAGDAPTAAREPLFDYSGLGNVPHVRQFDLPRYEPARGVPERTQAIISDPNVREKMLRTIEEGEKLGGSRWYNADPLREVFVREYGRERGDEAFRKYMDLVAATSPRSEVGANARNASYYFHRAMTGQGMPEVGERNPQPYGHMAQRLHQMNAQRVAGAGWDPLNNPKPASFVENLVGNQQPVTVDTHAFRLPAIIARDPRFLETAFQVDKTAPKQNIGQMVARGELPIEEAARRPAYWQAQPKENEYAAMERYYKSLGQDLGLTPAQTQAAAWVGGGKLTGLKSDESKPFLQFFEDRIYKTAIEKNMDPQDVLKAFVRGQMPLYASGGSVTDNAIDTAKRIAKKSANIKEPA